MPPSIFSLIPALLFSLNAVYAAQPLVDFDRMGTVGLAGAFAGLDVFSNATVAFDPTTSTLLSRAADGALTRLASTDTGGSILAGCALSDVFYLAGNFSAVDSVAAANIAAYTPSSGAFAAVGSGGAQRPDKRRVLRRAGQQALGRRQLHFARDTPLPSLTPRLALGPVHPSAACLVPRQKSLPSPLIPQTQVSSSPAPSSPNSAAGTSFSMAPTTLMSPSLLAHLLSHLLSFLSLSRMPRSTHRLHQPPRASPTLTTCYAPLQAMGSGSSWFAADSSTPLITIRTFTFISASGLRLGNTFQPNHGTTGFRYFFLYFIDVRQGLLIFMLSLASLPFQTTLFAR